MAVDKFTVTIDSDLEELIPGFMENRKQDIAKLLSASETGDFETLRSIGHSLKGVGGGYGFMGISELGAQIEISAKSENLDSARESIRKLSEYLDSVVIRYE